MANTAEELLLRIQGDSSSGQQAVQQLADTLSNALAKALSQVKQSTDDSNQATSALKKYLDDLLPSTKDAHAAFTDLKGTLTGFWENPTQELGNFTKALASELGPALGAVGVAAGLTLAAIAAVGTVAVSVADQSAKVGTAIQDATYKTGASVPVISTWRGALEIAGGSLDQFSSAIFMMQRRMTEAGPQFEAGLTRINLSMSDLQALEPDQQFLRLAQGIQQVADPAARAAAAMELFGRPGRDLLPLIMKNLDDLVGVSVTLGSTWSEKDAKSAEELEMATRQLDLAMGNLSSTIGKSLTPALTGVKEGVATVVGGFAFILDEQLQNFEAGLQRLKDKYGDAAHPTAPGAPKMFADAGGAAEFDKTTKAMEAQRVAAADLAAYLQALQDKNVTLTEHQQTETKIMLEAGVGVDVIVQKLNKAEPQFQVTTAAVDQFKTSLEYAKKYTNEWNAALSELAPILRSPAWDGSIESMLRLGGAVKDTAIYFGESEGSVRKHLEAMKDFDKIVGIEATKSAQDLNNELAKLGTAIPEKFFTDTAKAIGELQKIESGAGFAAKELGTMGVAAKPSLNELNATFGTIGLNFEQLEKESISGLQHTANTARDTYEFMDAHHEMFADATIRRYKAIADEAQRAADGSKDAWDRVGSGLDDASRVLSVIPGQFAKVASEAISAASDIMNAYEAGGGGVTGAINAAVAAVVDLGKALVGIGGPSKDELAARDTFGKQFKDASDLLTQVSAAGVVLGKNGEEVRAMAQRVLDATHISAAAEASALKDVNDLLDQAKNRLPQLKTTMDGFQQGLTISSDALKTYDTLNEKQLTLAITGQKLTDEEKQQLNTAGVLYDTTRVKSQDAAAAVAASIVGLTNANVKAGMSFTDAVKAAQPAVQALQAQLNATGFTGGKAFDFLRQEVDLANDAIAGPALQSIHGYTQGLKGLSDAELLDQTTFAGLTSQISGTEQALLKQGYSAGTVSVAMQSDLQTLWEMEQRYGYKADETTQALIDQGVQSGLIGENQKKTDEKVLDVLVAIADALGAKIPASLKTFQKAGTDAAGAVADAMGKIPTNIETTVSINAAAVPSTTVSTPTFSHPVESDGLVTLSPAAAARAGATRLNAADAAWWEWQASLPGAAIGGLVTPEGIQYLTDGVDRVQAISARMRGLARGSDTVPAMLTPGEAVLTRRAAATLGPDLIGRLNRGFAPSDALAGTAAPGLGAGIVVHVNVEGSIRTEGEFVRSITDAIRRQFNQRGGPIPLGAG